MKKFMNRADRIVADSLDGFVRAHEGAVVFGAGGRNVRRRELQPGKVAIISGGGAGHEPMHIGFVGHGMLDAACVGHIFTSATPDQIHAAIVECDTGAGVLLIVKNYDGDVMNFEMAAEMAVAAGHKVETVIVSDDIATRADARRSGRRGVAGTLVVEKIVGAAAEAGMMLGGLKVLGERTVAATRSMGVAIRGATVPASGRAAFTLSPEEMEVGVGIHGEPGRTRAAFAPADAIADLLCREILADLAASAEVPVLLFVNGFGGTPASELYLMYGLARARIEQAGLQVARSLVGTYVTSLDMAGLSITVSLLDEQRLLLWDAAVSTAALRWGV